MRDRAGNLLAGSPRMQCRLRGAGPNLVRIARRNLAEFPRVAIVNARFEDFDPAGAAFNMVFAAAAWHWIDPEVRYAKAASVLKPGGVLAFTWSAHAFPPGFDPFFTKIQKAYDAIGQSWQGGWPPPPPEQVPDLSEEIERSGYFEDVRVARHVWTTDSRLAGYKGSLDAASCADWLVERGRLEPSVSREFLPTENRRRCPGSFASKSAKRAPENEFAFSSAHCPP